MVKYFDLNDPFNDLEFSPQISHSHIKVTYDSLTSTIKGNLQQHAPFVTKELSMVIMNRSSLKNRCSK